MIDDSHARFAVEITLDVMGGCGTVGMSADRCSRYHYHIWV